MSFRLQVDGRRWEAHQRAVLAEDPRTVPVVKGNGYGFGRALLAGRAAELGVPTIAVGTRAEVADVRAHHRGDVLVLDPLLPGWTTRDDDGAGPPDSRLVRTVARMDVLAQVSDLARLGSAPRVVVELESPVQRHGIGWDRLAEMHALLRGVEHRGFSLHLPLSGDNVRTTAAALERLSRLSATPSTLWVSHLPAGEAARLEAAAPAGTRLKVRTGTRLWLGDRGALQATGTVLDARPVRRGEVVGYRQRRVAGAGTVLVVSGGTAHGVGMEAPRAGVGACGRAREILRGLAHGVRNPVSPFRWRGHLLAYADLPHMQVCMLLVPDGERPPVLGERLPCDVRMTTSTFDEVDVSYPLRREAAGTPGGRSTGR